MSRIAKTIKEMKSKKNRESWKEGKKITVTVRFDEFTIYCLDKISQDIGGSRTANACKILEEGISEGLTALGYDFESLRSEYMQQSGGGFSLDGVRFDPSEVPDLLANPEKYGIPVVQMTEEELADAEERERAENESKEQEGK